MDFDLSLFGAIENQRAAIDSLSEGGTALKFENGWILAVYNEHQWVNEFGEAIPSPTSGFLERIELERETLVLWFAGGARAKVDLSAAGYSGPEALALHGPDGELIVWS